jgi:hypothetical protein
LIKNWTINIIENTIKESSREKTGFEKKVSNNKDNVHKQISFLHEVLEKYPQIENKTLDKL